MALGLLGYAGYFSYTKKELVDEVTGQLNDQTTQLKNLTTRDPFPSQSNIDLAKQEQQHAAELLDKIRKFFMPMSSFTNLDSAGFKSFLETTIFQLEHDAKDAGVELPSKFAFTFTPQRTRVDFASDTLVPLATRLAEIKALCQVLFDAKIHSLISLRRVQVAKEDESANDYLVGKKPVTNAVTGTVSSPYEIVFQGFTSELAGVLDGFARSPHCFIVKNLDVQTNAVTAAATTDAAPVYYQSVAPPPVGGQSTALQQYEMLRNRYRASPYSRGSRPYMTPQPPPATPAAPVFTAPVHRGPETVLDERPLKITMYVEAVTLAPASPPPSPKPKPAK